MPDDLFASSLSIFFSSMGFGESKKLSFRTIQLNRSGQSYSLTGTTSTNTPQLSLTLPPSLLKEIISAIPLQDLSSLSLNLSIHIHTLIECFGKFQHLGAIAFEGCVGGWTKTMHITDEMAADEVAFPGLHTISVNGDILSEGIGFNFKDFENWLRNRHNRNVRLRKLTFSDS